MRRTASTGVQPGVDWFALDVHLREHKPGIGAWHAGVPTFVVSMPRGRVAQRVGGVITPDDGLLVEASFGFVADPRDHPLRRRLRLGPIEHLDGTVATIATAQGHVYFHWLFDVLPRLEILRRAGWDGGGAGRLVVNEPTARFQQETLARLGVRPEHMVAVPPAGQIRADRLVAPSAVGVSGNVPRWAVEFLRDRFLPPSPPPVRDPLRLYISRADAPQRRVADEDRLVRHLEARGFTTVTLGGRSLDEQVALFSRAEVVVAPHGGGLSNLVWCRPGTAVVELYADDYVNPVFWGLSELLGLRHHHVVGRPATPGARRGMGGMAVDLDAVLEATEVALTTSTAGQDVGGA
jgi:capsular polysaccharide biosynthesis protein